MSAPERELPSAAPRVAPARRSRLWTVVRALLGLIGLAVVVGLVREVGTETLMDTIVPALPWLPLATALELARIGMDALSSHFSLGRRARVPWLPMMGAHLVAYAIMGVSPLGRAASEAMKASLLARWTGAGTAVALGTANQANTLLSSGTFTLFSAAAAYAVTGPSILTLALVLHVIGMNASGLALRAAARYERFGAWLGARVPRIAEHIAAFHATSRETSLYPPRPVLAMMMGRALQAVHFGVLAMAVGLSPGVLGALALHGTYLVIAAIGVLVPGQIGASEGGFALAAETLDATVPQAVAVALLSHVVQLALVGAGFVVLATWRPARAAT